MLKLLRERGYEARSMTVSHLDEVREDVEGLYKKGLLAEDLYKEYLFRFKYFVPVSFPEAKSIIVVSVPQPTCEVSFNVKGRKVRTIVPPTYARAVDVDMEIVDLLEKGDGNGVHLSVYGDTVGIIGNSVQMPVARTAVDMLLSGSEHATVYKFLERKRAELHIAEMGFDL